MGIRVEKILFLCGLTVACSAPGAGWNFHCADLLEQLAAIYKIEPKLHPFEKYKPKPKPPVDPDLEPMDYVIARAESDGVRPMAMLVGPLASKKIKPVPFGTFHYGETEYSYSAVPEEAKKLSNGKHEIYYGKPAKSLEDAERIIQRYFTEGVSRSEKGKHFDVAKHQRSEQGAIDSGFSNGSENWSVADYFARADVVGIIFLIDVSGEQILNLPAFQPFAANTTFAREKEILTRGGRSPEKVRAAALMDGAGTIKKLYTNPNFRPSEGPKP